uniref:Uncharacterized protein n=1 Tax=Bos indicus x Bos taurus TaxID=30522 RepID=A0A4W2I1C9_BOBOX
MGSVYSLPWETNLASLKQGLRILILMPQIMNGKAITFCVVVRRQIILLKILLKIDEVFVFSG